MEVAKRLIIMANKFDKLENQYQIIIDTLEFIKKNKEKDPVGYAEKVKTLTIQKHEITAKQIDIMNQINKANTAERRIYQNRLSRIAHTFNHNFKYGRNRL